MWCRCTSPSTGYARPSRRTQLAVQTRIRTTPTGGVLPVSDCDTATPKAPAVCRRYARVIEDDARCGSVDDASLCACRSRPPPGRTSVRTRLVAITGPRLVTVTQGVTRA